MLNKWRESTTFKLVLLHLGFIDFMWLSGKTEASLTEFSTAIATVLAIWLGREWRAAHYKGE